LGCREGAFLAKGKTDAKGEQRFQHRRVSRKGAKRTQRANSDFRTALRPPCKGCESNKRLRAPGNFLNRLW